MIVDMGKIKAKLKFAYDNYEYKSDSSEVKAIKQEDDLTKKIDWLEGILDGVYTQEENGELWIVFRGTDPNRKSDNVNMKMLPHRLPYVGVNPKIWVHTGLIDLYDRPECRGILKKKVTDALNRGLKIWVIGHSQGGGMAQICAVDLQCTFSDRLNENNFFVVPVAPMRAGNKHFVKSFNRRIPNAVLTWKGSDMVPHIPPVWFGYHLPGYRVNVDPRSFFRKIGNFFWAAIKFPFVGRKDIHKNPDRFISWLTILASGPDWYFINDHDVDDWPEVKINTEELSINKVNKVKA